jgi:hypothetical protein
MSKNWIKKYHIHLYILCAHKVVPPKTDIFYTINKIQKMLLKRFFLHDILLSFYTSYKKIHFS